MEERPAEFTSDSDAQPLLLREGSRISRTNIEDLESNNGNGRTHIDKYADFFSKHVPAWAKNKRAALFFVILCASIFGFLAGATIDSLVTGLVGHHFDVTKIGHTDLDLPGPIMTVFGISFILIAFCLCFKSYSWFSKKSKKNGRQGSILVDENPYAINVFNKVTMGVSAVVFGFMGFVMAFVFRSFLHTHFRDLNETFSSVPFNVTSVLVGAFALLTSICGIGLVFLVAGVYKDKHKLERPNYGSSNYEKAYRNEDPYNISDNEFSEDEGQQYDRSRRRANVNIQEKFGMTTEYISDFPGNSTSRTCNLY